ncbi:hypothetical protein [Streptomyces lacrimifluminis]
MSVGSPGGPLATGCWAHLAVAWSWHTTMSAVGSPYVVHKYDV